MKALKRHNDMLGFVADAAYGVPTKCPCGGGIIPEVSPCNKFPNDFDTQPGRRYFTCKNFEVIFIFGFHTWKLVKNSCRAKLVKLVKLGKLVKLVKLENWKTCITGKTCKT